MEVATTVPGQTTVLGHAGHHHGRGDEAKDAVFAHDRHMAIADDHINQNVSDGSFRNARVTECGTRATELAVERARRDSVVSLERAEWLTRERILDSERRIEDRIRADGDRTRDLIQAFERDRLARALALSNQTLLAAQALRISGLGGNTPIPSPPND